MRAWLFVPGHDERKLKKALSSEADVVIVDWEDAVPEEKKPEARKTTAALLAASEPGPRVVLRVNHPESAFFEADLEALPLAHVSALVLPKVEAPGELERARRAGLPLIAMIESARAVLSLSEIARARPERFVFGALDYLKDVGARPTREALLFARSLLVNESRAAGLEPPIGGVWPYLEDEAGLLEEARHERDLGFAGKTLLHPKQIEPVKRAFTPTEAEVREARAILAAWEAARAEGRAVAKLPDGRFLDPPVVAWAERILKDAS